MKEYSIVIFYNKDNRNSFRALLGALEKYALIDIFDFYFPSKFDELDSLLNRLNHYKKVFLLFSLMTTQFVKFFNKFNSLNRKNLIKICGGPHATGLPFSLKDFFEYVFIKEAENSLPEFLKRFVEGKDIENCEGIIYWRNGIPFIKPLKREVDLNSFPPFSEKLERYGPIEITRGCAFSCKYCQTSYMMGKKLRHRKEEFVFEWVEYLFGKGMRDIRFITPNAFSYGSQWKKSINLEAIYNLLSGIRKIVKKEGRIFFGSFPSEVRPDYVNEEVMKILRDFCDNKNIVIGCQSGSDRILRYINREHTVEDVLRAVEIAKKYNFTPIVDFIIGFPEETEEELRKTISLSEKLMEKGAVVHLHYFMPLPGTPFWKKRTSPLNRKISKWMGKFSSTGKLFGSVEKQFYFSREIQKIFDFN